jgi:hypothetical protein
MNEHTPGPWYYDGCVQIVEVERPHMRVAFLPSDHAEHASSKPNGRLIAAAPELLEALSAARAVLESLDHPMNGLDGLTFRHNGAPIGAIIDAAMAKATGSDPAVSSALCEKSE